MKRKERIIGNAYSLRTTTDKRVYVKIKEEYRKPYYKQDLYEVSGFNWDKEIIEDNVSLIIGIRTTLSVPTHIIDMPFIADDKGVLY